MSVIWTNRCVRQIRKINLWFMDFPAPLVIEYAQEVDGMKNYEFPDFTEKHKLTEQECTMLGLFRALGKTKRDAIIRTFWNMAYEDKKIVKLAEKRMEEAPPLATD